MNKIFDRVPLLQGNPAEEYDCADGAHLLLYNDKNSEDYSCGCRELTNGGFSLFSSTDINGNLQSHFVKDGLSVIIRYTPAEKKIRLIADPFTALYPTEKGEGETATLWQLEIDHSLIDCGMCYAVKCPNGHFFMIDSAHFYSVPENDRIYDFLRRNTPAGEKIIIDGWFFSHGHADHICKFADFLRYNMNGDVEIKALYYNFISGTHRDSVNWDPADRQFTANFRALVAESGIPCVKLHSGAKFYINNLEFEVLCTHEDVWPASCRDYNNSSTVLLMRCGPTTVLFPGDASDEESKIMELCYGDYLKSDIVQVAHHGHFGCSSAFYRFVNAPLALFPVTTIKFREEYPRIEADRVVCELAKAAPIASEGTVEIPLPYDGSFKVYPDETFEDFEGIFNLWTYTYTDEYKKELYADYLARGGRKIEKYEKLLED